MLPAPRLALCFLAVSLLLLAGGVWAPLAPAGGLALAALAVYAAIDLCLLPRRRGLEIRRRLPGRLSLAEPTSVYFDVRYTGRRPIRLLLAERLPDGFEAGPAVCAATLAPGQETTLTYRLTARRRGAYTLAAADVRIRPAMGLFERQFRLDARSDIQVFPNLANLERYELLLRRGLTREQGLARLRQLGQGMEFESLRQYGQGDDISRVDWKATAKRSQLIVKNFQPERQQSVIVALDVGRATAGEFAGLSRLDYLVNATLMLAYVVLRQGDWFSLLAFSDRIESYLPPVRGVAKVEKVAEALHNVHPRLVESDYGTACRFLDLKNRKRSLLCLMTDVIDRHASDVVLAYMARFARRHLPLAITLANPEINDLAEQPLAQTPDPYAKAVATDVLTIRQEALLQMRRLGVGVLDVPPDALTAKLINRYLLIKSTRRL